MTVSRIFLSLLVAVSFLGGSAYADDAKPLTNFKLVNQDGVPFDLHSLKGSYTLLSFVFTRCPMPNMCPMNVTLNKRLIKEWSEQSPWRRDGFPIRILLVTLDPEYDTPQRLKQFADSQGLDYKYFTLATGDPKILSDLASEFNVMGIPGGGTISHNMKTELLSPLMIPLKEYKDNAWSTADVLKEMKHYISWWSWFFVFASLLAIPGLVLLRKIRRYNIDSSQI